MRAVVACRILDHGWSEDIKKELAVEGVVTKIEKDQKPGLKLIK